MREFGRLDILVNNAGIGLGSASITDMSLADFRRQQAVNVEGVFLGVKHGLKAMRAAGNGGSIVNMSSVAGLKGSPILAAYCATKGAVRLFTKAVALECAAAKDGVRVNSVHPGIIETPIWESIAGLDEPARQRPAGPRRHERHGRAAGGQGHPRGHRRRRALAGRRGVALCHRRGDGDRRRPVYPMTDITTFLWYDKQAEEAARFYVSLFPNSKIDAVTRTPADNPGTREGQVITVGFTLCGRSFTAMNGGPGHPFTDAISISVSTADQAETDRLWNALVADGGQEVMCGWLKDRFGLSWQITPEILPRLLGDPDRDRARRAMQAMMTMVKIDIAALEKAADGRG